MNKWEDIIAFITHTAETIGEAVAPEAVLPIEAGLTGLMSALEAGFASKPWTLAYKIGHVGKTIIDNHNAGTTPPAQ